MITKLSCNYFFKNFDGGGGVTVWAGVFSQYRTALHFVNGTVTSPYYLNNINSVTVPLHEQHRPIFIFMDDNAPAHRGRIIREWLLETGVPQMEWPALSPELQKTMVTNPPGHTQVEENRRSPIKPKQDKVKE